MTTVDKITHISILSQVLQNYLLDKKASNYFKQKLKKTCNLFLDELYKVETNVYDKFFEENEDSTNQVYDIADEFYKTVSEVPIYEMENFIQVWKAYQKDKSSIEGIVKKILR